MRLLAAIATGIVLFGAAPAPPTPSPPTPSPPAPSAPSAVTWGVSPSSAKGPNGRPAFTYKLDPGATLTDYVAVTNHSSRPLTLNLYASDAFTTAQGGFDLLAGGQKPTDVGAWVRFTGATVTIPSTSRLDIPFTLTVPNNATPGDHAGGIVASLAATAADAQGNQVAVDHRVGARIYLRVSGELRPALAVEDLRVRHTGSLNPLAGGTLTATFTVRNTGNVRLTGQPALAASGPFGLGRRSTDGAALAEILPGGELTTTVRMTGVPPLFQLTASAAVAPAAVGDQVLDPQPHSRTARTTVWAMPWPQMGLLVLLALVGWALIAARRRRARQIARTVAAAREEGRSESSRETERTLDGREAPVPAAIGVSRQPSSDSEPPQRPASDADDRGPGHNNRQPDIDRTVQDER
ncbi:WxL protein peptidoglycan domain-containing protein [Micromonospora sp. NPDC049102]|uniref:WxL protein peptidoglycan domain-containing protein n=1 Tax=Micromonospora sp. NPDC049102 TaxID=3364265 RepID=UPI00371429B0